MPMVRRDLLTKTQGLSSKTQYPIPKTLLVTGGAGFIGSNFIHHIITEHPDWEIVNLDKLTYAGNLENLKDTENNPRYRFIKGDIADRKLISSLLQGKIDAIINFAAESHVDRSILDASPFIETNIKGTQVLLEAARTHWLGSKTQDPTSNTQDLRPNIFLQVSTDEVYGSTEKGKFSEESPLSPNSPYSASKAAADLLCHAYWKTYQLPVIITRCSNNLGPFQFPEKLIPLAITNALENKPIPIYGDGMNVRDWIYVLDHCRALDLVLQKGKPGEIYNIAANQEKTNLELIHRLLDVMDKPQSLIKFVADRPGHDRRYALDITKITRELGWQPIYSFEGALTATVNWYLDHESWWRQIKSGDYAKYYDRMYSHR
jgi:dTDP-glucose 4,6-dehydratase